MLINPITICVELFGKALLQAQANRAVEQERLADKSRRARELAAKKAREAAAASSRPSTTTTTGAALLAKGGSGVGVGYRNEPTIWRRSPEDARLWVIYVRSEGGKLALYANPFAESNVWIRLGDLGECCGYGWKTVTQITSRIDTRPRTTSYAIWAQDARGEVDLYSFNGWRVDLPADNPNSYWYQGVRPDHPASYDFTVTVLPEPIKVSEGTVIRPAETGPILKGHPEHPGLGWAPDKSGMNDYDMNLSYVRNSSKGWQELTYFADAHDEDGNPIGRQDTGGVLVLYTWDTYTVVSGPDFEKNIRPDEHDVDRQYDHPLNIVGTTGSRSRDIQVGTPSEGSASGTITITSTTTNLFTEDVRPWSPVFMNGIYYRAPEFGIGFSVRNRSVRIWPCHVDWASDSTDGSWLSTSLRVSVNSSYSSAFDEGGSASQTSRVGTYRGSPRSYYGPDETLLPCMKFFVSGYEYESKSWFDFGGSGIITSSRSLPQEVFDAIPNTLQVAIDLDLALQSVEAGHLSQESLDLVLKTLGITERTGVKTIAMPHFGRSEWTWSSREFAPVGFAVF